MQHDPAKLKSVLQAASPPDLELDFRPMFGGVFGYAGGKPFASLSNVGLALKMVGADHSAFKAIPGVEPLRYEPDDPPSKSYLVVSDALLADADGLRPWILRSVAGLKTAPKRPRKSQARSQ